jgi:hypothetical protein
MTFEKIRRFVFAVAAIALFLATVLPNIGMTVSMPDMGSNVISPSSSMMCPDCPTKTVKFGSPSCVQGMCIGLALIATNDLPFATNHQKFLQLAIVPPDEIALAPPTPPI